jgi:hypothetical protein
MQEKARRVMSKCPASLDKDYAFSLQVLKDCPQFVIGREWNDWSRPGLNGIAARRRLDDLKLGVPLCHRTIVGLFPFVKQHCVTSIGTEGSWRLDAVPRMFLVLVTFVAVTIIILLSLVVLTTTRLVNF